MSKLTIPSSPVTTVGSTSAGRWHAEGFAGVCHNEITPAIVRRLAGAFAAALFEVVPQGERPNVVLASDGRLSAVEFVSAAGEGLRWAGCNLVELGTATLGSASLAVSHFQADGGVFIGNAPSELRTLGLKFWGRSAQPWSLGGGLDRVRQLFDDGFSRPMRTAGRFERGSIQAEYRETLSGMFHALRPLRFVLDTVCNPLDRLLRELLKSSSCQIIIPQPLPADEVRPKAGSKPADPHARRLRMVKHQVLADGMDFGIWIDGDGDACRLFDEHGRTVEPAALAAALPATKFLYYAASTRESTFANFKPRDETAAADDRGRYWFRTTHDAPQCDALLTLAVLLNVLSQSDLPLSKVMAATIANTA